MKIGGQKIRALMRLAWVALPRGARMIAAITTTWRWLLRSRLRYVGMAGVLAVTAASIGWLCLPEPALLEGTTFSHEVYDRDHNLLRVTLTPDEKFRIFTPLDKIPPELIEATLLHEDRYYREHPWVNPICVARWAWNLLLSGHIPP